MHVPTEQPARSTFGPLLRHWRQSRRISQLMLATEADISGRHLSFLETGRAQPSREMVQRLANVLDVPLSDQNALFVAAGFAPIYGRRELSEPDLAPVRRALDFILQQQEPFPAIVMDGGWNVIMLNNATKRLFGRLHGNRELARNAMRTLFHPDGIRPHIANWEEFAGYLIQVLHREAATGLETTVRLRDELLAYDGVPTHWRLPDTSAPRKPMLTMRLQSGDSTLTFFSMLTTFAKPLDVTLEQLRVECFFPADSLTEEFARTVAASAASKA